MSKLDLFLQRLPHLVLSKQYGQRKPYKPLMLLAVLTLIEEDGQATELVVLDPRLVERVRDLARALLPEFDVTALTKAVVAEPWRHLSSDFIGTGLWELVAAPGQQQLLDAARAGAHKLRAVLARSADERLRHAVSANSRLSLWTYDVGMEICRV